VTIAIDDSVVKWSETGSLAGRPFLLLLHGYAQDENQLDAITAAVSPPFVTAALRGPRPARAPRTSGYGWYDVDDRIVPLPGQDVETVNAILAWLDTTFAERGTPTSVFVAGFSQGAALSLHLLRSAPERWTAVVTLAGYWLAGTVKGEAALDELRTPVFWGRSEGDPAVVPAYVDATRAALMSFAPDAEHVYPGDSHAVLPEMVVDLTAFLHEQLA